MNEEILIETSSEGIRSISIDVYDLNHKQLKNIIENSFCYAVKHDINEILFLGLRRNLKIKVV